MGTTKRGKGVEDHGHCRSQMRKNENKYVALNIGLAAGHPVLDPGASLSCGVSDRTAAHSDFTGRLGRPTHTAQAVLGYG